MSDVNTATPASGVAQPGRLARLRMSSLGLVAMLIIQFIVLVFTLPSRGSSTT